jgi:hypothetical protein
MTVNEGEAFVAGADAETARQLLEGAEKAGLDPSVVRFDTAGGFVVPEELAPNTGSTKKASAKSAAADKK